MEQSSSRSISPSRRRLVRSPGANHGAVIGIVGILGFVALAVFGNHPVLAAICAAFLALLDLRLWLAGIRVGPEGVRIVSLLGVSRRAAWETIDHFAVAPFAGYPHVAHVVLRDGRDFACLAVSAAKRGDTMQGRLAVEGTVDELNATLAAWRTGWTGHEGFGQRSGLTR